MAVGELCSFSHSLHFSVSVFREVQGPVAEMVSRGPLETRALLDRLDQTDLQASVG